MKLMTEAQLAEAMELDIERVAQLRLAKKWPHVRLTRFDVRYTEAQVDQIIRAHSVVPANTAAGSTGLTERSARRAS